LHGRALRETSLAAGRTTPSVEGTRPPRQLASQDQGSGRQGSDPQGWCDMKAYNPQKPMGERTSPRCSKLDTAGGWGQADFQELDLAEQGTLETSLRAQWRTGSGWARCRPFCTGRDVEQDRGKSLVPDDRQIFFHQTKNCHAGSRFPLVRRRGVAGIRKNRIRAARWTVGRICAGTHVEGAATIFACQGGLYRAAAGHKKKIPDGEYKQIRVSASDGQLARDQEARLSKTGLCRTGLVAAE